MASLVRIKRRQSQEPAEALLLAAKRMKTESGADEASPVEKSVFKFCGSTDNAENYEVVSKLVEKGKQLSHRKSIKETTRTRAKSTPDPGASSSEKKYKVLSAFRNLEEVPIKVYDLVPEGEELPVEDDAVTCNGVPLVVEKNTSEDKVQYVYDFYYSDVGAFDDTYIDQLMSVKPCFYNPGEDSDSDKGEETDDSNDENNWRNDYPSTESDDDCDDDIVGKMTGMYIDDDDEGSGSSDEEGFVYAKYDDDLVHGAAYSEYKRRVMKELYDSHSGSEEPEDHSSYEQESD